ncbi:MAG: hypothetical protein MUP58_02305 [Candidatus Nanohaloarchaeota archaeon QJJ-9]|nr:hypothetical protein [Candidatus Nanohaloarchaeota archaeon QJJ-9]
MSYKLDVFKPACLLLVFVSISIHLASAEVVIGEGTRISTGDGTSIKFGKDMNTSVLRLSQENVTLKEVVFAVSSITDVNITLLEVNRAAPKGRNVMEFKAKTSDEKNVTFQVNNLLPDKYYVAKMSDTSLKSLVTGSKGEISFEDVWSGEERFFLQNSIRPTLYVNSSTIRLEVGETVTKGIGLHNRELRESQYVLSSFTESEKGGLFTEIQGGELVEGGKLITVSQKSQKATSMAIGASKCFAAECRGTVTLTMENRETGDKERVTIPVEINNRKKGAAAPGIKTLNMLVIVLIASGMLYFLKRP